MIKRAVIDHFIFLSWRHSRKKQQELEDEHEEIEFELRRLLSKSDEEKTPSERVLEQSLLQELVATVSLRNSIVDTLEENRLK